MKGKLTLVDLGSKFTKLMKSKTTNNKKLEEILFIYLFSRSIKDEIGSWERFLKRMNEDFTENLSTSITRNIDVILACCALKAVHSFYLSIL